MKFNLDENSFFIHGSLTGEDLLFFYNSVGMEVLQDYPLIYDWSKAVEEFQNRIKFIAIKGNPKISGELIENTISFHINNSPKSDKGLSAPAFFRHLRNAFAHYRIIRNGEWYIITDINTKGKITMKGKVKTKDLFDFCFRLYELKENFIDNHKITDHKNIK